MSEELVELARLGMDAEVFMQTPLGKFLYDKANGEIAAATEKLIDSPPYDTQAGIEIRNHIHIARMFLVWIVEAMTIGRAAHNQLQEIDDMERET